MLTVSKKYNCLMKDGKPFFYMADTIWSAFTNPKMDEWETYLKVRSKQGFNVLQINILPQGDRSDNTWDNPMPFALNSEEKEDYSKINDEYFQRAGKMLEMAVSYGFTPGLVLLWGDRVYGTWSNITFNSNNIPLECVEPYVRKCVESFKKFEPIWFVSGDTNFPKESRPWFDLAHKIVKEMTPSLLCAYHTGSEPLEEEMMASNKPDFYTYQSGHSLDSQNLTYKLAEAYSRVKIIKPVINTEPCYEGIGNVVDGTFKRVSRDDVRRAMWWSLIGGAKAGITYGAHGVWNWHRTGVFFCAKPSAGEPLDWSNAINLPGAWDISFAKELFLEHELYKLNPTCTPIDGNYSSIKCMSNADESYIAIYTPHTCEIEINKDMSKYNIKAINLKKRCCEVLTVNNDIIYPGSDNADYLIFLSRK